MGSKRIVRWLTIKHVCVISVDPLGLQSDKRSQGNVLAGLFDRHFCEIWEYVQHCNQHYH